MLQKAEKSETKKPHILPSRTSLSHPQYMNIFFCSINLNIPASSAKIQSKVSFALSKTILRAKLFYASSGWH